ncbi:MAG: hypothetical protein HW378_3047 [Anaerolineales bacterium]|jgi:DUF971 family protein|nr:hypothetical protein [Anaerolineales bacterium]
MPRPTAITLDRTRKLLIISWDEGHQSEYPLAGLREACPCVECRGGHENMGAPPDPDVFNLIPLAPTKSYGVTKIIPVGNYALQPEWSDGHHTGIYTWAYLRGLCPCAECRKRR